MDKPKVYWKNSVDDTKVEVNFKLEWEVLCLVTTKLIFIPSVEHVGSIMTWPCFAASGPAWLTVTDGSMNPEWYKLILQEKRQDIHVWIQQNVDHATRQQP